MSTLLEMDCRTILRKKRFFERVETTFSFSAREQRKEARCSVESFSLTAVGNRVVWKDRERERSARRERKGPENMKKRRGRSARIERAGGGTALSLQLQIQFHSQYLVVQYKSQNYRSISNSIADARAIHIVCILAEIPENYQKQHYQHINSKTNKIIYWRYKTLDCASCESRSHRQDRARLLLLPARAEGSGLILKQF